VVAGLWFVRRRGLAVLAGLFVGASLLAARWPGEVEAY
jgi:hypothetical protein